MSENSQPAPAGWAGASTDDLEDGPAVCPEHLRFVPCRRCAPGETQYSSDPVDVARARAYQQGTPEEAPTCLSGGHQDLPATVEGVFDCSHLNGRAPMAAAYCTRCAIGLEVGGMFTPVRALSPQSPERIAALYPADALPGILAASPRTYRLLTGS